MNKQLPTKLKIIRGTLDKSKVLEKEMEGTFLKKMPSVPATLNGKGKKFWNDTGNDLIEQGILFKEDLLLFEIYCDLLEYIQNLRIDLKKNPPVTAIYKNRGGNEYASKSKTLAMYLECRRSLISIGGEFGLSPSARTKIPGTNKIKDKQQLKDKEMFR